MRTPVRGWSYVGGVMWEAHRRVSGTLDNVDPTQRNNEAESECAEDQLDGEGQ